MEGGLNKRIRQFLAAAGLEVRAPFGSESFGQMLESSRLLVALSGGADSVALLHALLWLRELRGSRTAASGLVAAHFNHGIRGAEAERDEIFASNLCAELGVRFVAGRGNVLAETVRTGESMEMAARRLRWEFLRGVARECGCRAIAVGHTLDDRVEGFFLRLWRGASLRGLSGIAPFPPDIETVNLPILRPLLTVRHKELVALLQDLGLKWCEDSTNAQDDALRNRVRHHLVPVVEQIGGDVIFTTIGRTLDNLRADANALDEIASRFVEKDKFSAKILQVKNEWIEVDAYSRRVISNWLLSNGVDPEQINIALLDSLTKAARRGVSVRIPVDASKLVQYHGGAFSIIDVLRSNAGECAIAIWLDSAPDRGKVVALSSRLEVSVSECLERPQRSSPLELPLSCTCSTRQLVGRALELRPFRAGDFIKPVGAGNTRKISDLLPSLGVNRFDRSKVMVLCVADTSEVLWLPGYGVSEKIAVGDGDDILRLTLKPEE